MQKQPIDVDFANARVIRPSGRGFHGKADIGREQHNCGSPQLVVPSGTFKTKVAKRDLRTASNMPPGRLGHQ